MEDYKQLITPPLEVKWGCTDKPDKKYDNYHVEVFIPAEQMNHDLGDGVTFSHLQALHAKYNIEAGFKETVNEVDGQDVTLYDNGKHRMEPKIQQVEEGMYTLKFASKYKPTIWIGKDSGIEHVKFVGKGDTVSVAFSARFSPSEKGVFMPCTLKQIKVMEKSMGSGDGGSAWDDAVAANIPDTPEEAAAEPANDTVAAVDATADEDIF